MMRRNGDVSKIKNGNAAIKRHSRIRLVMQCLWFALTNGYAYGFLEGKIYTGKAKAFCVPGLNCYSCPGATGSCPIGTLQAILGGSSGKFPFYVFGFLMMFGSLFGRFICGWLCPFGLLQDLLYKIPLFKNSILRKRRNLPAHKYLTKIKYVILAVFVIFLPLAIRDAAGNGSPWFCEYICPSGTFLGGIPLVSLNPGLRTAVGGRFWWKTGVLVTVIVASIKVNRPFCKYLCPLGAAYGFFNPVSLYRFSVDDKKCTSCGACHAVCKMDIDPSKTPNSMECIRCGDCLKACPHGAIERVKLLQTAKAAETGSGASDTAKAGKTGSGASDAAKAGKIEI